MNQKNILRVAVAGCFGVVAGQAFAVVDLSVNPATGVTKFAKEIPSTTTTLTNNSQSLDVKVKVPGGYAVSAANPLYVKLNLTNGARFAANPTLRCGTGTTDSAGATNTVSGVLTLGGIATSYAVFAVENTVTTVMSGACSATMGDMTISGLNNVSVSADVEYKSGLTNAVSGISNSYITFVRGVSANILEADGSVVVDATSGSDNFTTGSNKNSQFLATLGTVTWGATNLTAADAAGAQSTAGSVSAASVVPTTGFVTVNGPAIGAAMAANGNSGIFLSVSGGLAGTACSTRSYTVSASAANSVTFNNVSPTDLSAGLAVCINVSGATTVIGNGQMTASISGTPATSVTADFTAASNKMELVTTNGTTKNAFMINASTSTAKTSVVRIINTGAVSAAFTATAYTVDAGAADGAPVAATVLGTANSALGTVAAGGALTLTSAQLEAKLGFTPSSGTSKYRVVISAGTDAMEVLNYTKDVATGAIVTSQAQTN